jgi:hypothetical protein
MRKFWWWSSMKHVMSRLIGFNSQIRIFLTNIWNLIEKIFMYMSIVVHKTSLTQAEIEEFVLLYFLMLSKLGGAYSSEISIENISSRLIARMCRRKWFKSSQYSILDFWRRSIWLAVRVKIWARYELEKEIFTKRFIGSIWMHRRNCERL